MSIAKQYTVILDEQTMDILSDLLREKSKVANTEDDSTMYEELADMFDACETDTVNDFTA